MTINNMIHLQGERRVVEYPANAAITPGMLVEVISTKKVQKHATAGGEGENAFATEDALRGKTVADDYAEDDVVTVSIEQPGSIVNALLLAGSNYTVGTLLISAGDGTLKPTTGTPAKTFAVVVEAVDLSASAAVNTLGRVRIL